MESAPLLLVASAFSHATWNVLAKKGEDKEAYMWIMVTTSLVTLIPVYIIILPDWSFPLAALPYMLVSAAAGVLILREKYGRVRLVSSTVIFLGVYILAVLA
jgi:drug/metabolite transporter (DMT)-like permease